MSTDYNEGDPTSDGNWTELSVTLDTDTDSWSSWTDSGSIDLSSVTGGMFTLLLSMFQQLQDLRLMR